MKTKLTALIVSGAFSLGIAFGFANNAEAAQFQLNNIVRPITTSIEDSTEKLDNAWPKEIRRSMKTRDRKRKERKDREKNSERYDRDDKYDRYDHRDRYDRHDRSYAPPRYR